MKSDMISNRGVRVFYSPGYVMAAHSFETTCKAQWVAESLRDAPIGGITLVEAATGT
jgi:hypothetical protein